MSENLVLLAEEKWKEKIVHFSEDLYTGHWLPSHDLNHHLRVWHLACELSYAINEKHGMINDQFFEKLLIACLFHDLGLLSHKGEDHGRISRELCENFLSNGGYPKGFTYIGF